jgi:hypothetical protein
MTAGEKRKFYKNMQHSRSARTLAIVGANLTLAMGPIALVLLAVGFAYAFATGHNPLSHGAVGVMAAAAAPIVGSRDILEIVQESEKFELGMRDRSRRVVNFEEKLKAFIDLASNKKGMRRAVRAAALEEAASTSDFPILFGTVLERQLLAKYSIANVDWRQYIATGTQNDFRPKDMIGVYGLQAKLAAVKQRGEYKQDAQLGEGKVSISLGKYGAIFGLGWETLINDDLGAFSDIATRYANRALRTEYYYATALLAMSTGPHTSLFGAPIVHPIDGANVTNLGALPFSNDNLGAVCNKIRRQVDSDGEPIIVDGFDVVVPPALETELWKALNPAALIAVGVGNAAARATSANVVVQNLNITGHVNPYLPIIDTSGKGDATWYVIGKQNGNAPAAQINFLRGHEQPEIVMKAPNKTTLSGAPTSPMDGNFEEDTMWWRVRHVLGGVQIDPRLAYAETGS